MKYMVIESFDEGKLALVGERFRSQGRMLPEGVEYIESWLTPDDSKCYQLMKAATREALDIWIGRWSDLVDFEVTPVQTSAEFWANRTS